MKVLKERFIYFPFEYKAFIPYLNQMASKGWNLKTIEGNWLFSKFVFEKCNLKNIQYCTDFSIDAKYYQLRENQKNKDYHAFVEEYGYQYVCDYKGLVVYMRTTDSALELRNESSEESKKELRRATRNSLFPYSWIILYIALMIGTWKLNAMTFSNYGLLMALCTKVLVVMMLLVIMYSPIVWLFHPTLQKHMWVIRLRTIAVLSIASLYISLYMSGGQFTLYMLLCMTLLIIMTIGVFRSYFLNTSRIQKGCVSVGIIACILISYVVLSSTLIDEYNKRHSIPPFTSQELHQKDNDMSTYYSSGTWMLDVVEVSYKSGSYYTVYYLNDSGIKNYLQSAIPYEENVLHTIDKDGYILYEREKDVVLSKDDVILVMDTTMYRSIPSKEIKDLFATL